MKQTWREISVSRCIRRGVKYKWLKPLMFLEIVLVISVDRHVRYLKQNKKRAVGAGLTIFVFLASSSFATPAFQSQSEAVGIKQEEIVQLPAPVIEVYNEDTDVFEEEMGDYHEGAEEQYSVDEILSSTASQELINQSSEIREGAEFSKDDWNLILVNKQHPVPEDYTFQLGTITADMQCDARILPDLFAMLQAAREDGVNLIVCSPYRDITLQHQLFDRKINFYMGQGYSYIEAYKKASQIVTVPGASEHQIGLALDIISDQYTMLNEGFGETQAGKWLQEHSKEYGFILRYPKGKEYITGIDYEPWHFRYVGKEAATIIMNNGLTLEEFVESISE